jgi:DNA-binding NarL/FixJ family response regulator
MHHGVPACDEIRVVTAPVIIVDDHCLLAQGLSFTLGQQGTAVTTVATPDEARLVALVLERAPCLVLVDLAFEGSPVCGVDLIEPLRAAGATVVVLTGSKDPALLGTCLERGATAIAGKSEDFDQLLERIGRVLRGEPGMSVTKREELLAAARDARAAERRRWAPFEQLSPREREVLDRLAHGEAADTIASSTFVSLATVRTQIQSILRKLQVTSQLSAVALVHDAGWSLHGHSGVRLSH